MFWYKNVLCYFISHAAPSADEYTTSSPQISRSPSIGLSADRIDYQTQKPQFLKVILVISVILYKYYSIKIVK